MNNMFDPNSAKSIFLMLKELKGKTLREAVEQKLKSTVIKEKGILGN